MLSNLALFIAGILVLYIGGEVFIRGSSSTARIFGIKPLIIGLLITAFATSAPEFFVSFLAAARKSQDLAIGNIVGSCICNIGLVLGLAALFRPISVNVSILRRELPILFIVTVGFFLICLDLKITRPEALILLLAFFLFVVYCIKNAKAETKDIDIKAGKSLSRPRSFSYLAAGLLGLLLGAHIIVGSAVRLAHHFGISEFVIGLTAVAIGTSLPELATSLVASARGEGDISIGNVIGSNIFNMLAIIGAVCLIRPVTVEPVVVISAIPLLLLYTFALAPILKSGFKISRIEGGLLLASYLIYLYFIFRR
jgi:cation:H+ antiporter